MTSPSNKKRVVTDDDLQALDAHIAYAKTQGDRAAGVVEEFDRATQEFTGVLQELADSKANLEQSRDEAEAAINGIYQAAATGTTYSVQDIAGRDAIANPTAGQTAFVRASGEIYRRVGTAWVLDSALVTPAVAALNYAQAGATLAVDLITDVVPQGADSGGVYASSGFKILKSTDAGLTWNTLMSFSNAEGGVIRALKLTGWTTYTFLVLTLENGNFHFWLTNDSGSSKVEVTFGAVAGRTGPAWIAPLLDGMLCAANGDIYLAEYQNNGVDAGPDPVVWRIPKNATAAASVLLCADTRHLHFIRQSPTTGRLYVSAGDGPLESRMYQSADSITWTQSPISPTWRAYSLLFKTIGGVNYAIYGEDQEPQPYHPGTANFHRFVEGDFSTRQTSPFMAKGTIWTHIKLGEDLYCFSAPESTVPMENFGIYVYHSRDGLNWRETGALYVDTTKSVSANPPRVVQGFAAGTETAWVYLLNAPMTGITGNTTTTLRLQKVAQAAHGAALPLPIVRATSRRNTLPQVNYGVWPLTSDFGEGAIDWRTPIGDAGVGKSLWTVRSDLAFQGYLGRMYNNTGAEMLQFLASGALMIQAGGKLDAGNSTTAIVLPRSPTGYAVGSIGWDATVGRVFVRSLGAIATKNFFWMYRGEVAAEPTQLNDGEFWYRTDLRRLQSRQGGATVSVGQALSVNIRTAGASMLLTEDGVLANPATAGVGWTLQPAAAVPSREVFVRNIHAANSVQVNPNGTDLINGANTGQTVAPGATLRLFSDGTQWWTV
ncbi:hypothetical protein HLB42_09540 [Deinococcus sp. D7000]|nr:hypothetical protein HLB42_09540 [Deinococcus sp. D7000]